MVTINNTGDSAMKAMILALGLLFAGTAGAIDLSPSPCGVQVPTCYSVLNDAGAHVTILASSTSVFVYVNGIEYSANVAWQALAGGITMTSALGDSIQVTATFSVHTQCFTGGRGAGCRQVIYLVSGAIN